LTSVSAELGRKNRELNFLLICKIIAVLKGKAYFNVIIIIIIIIIIMNTELFTFQSENMTEDIVVDERILLKLT
jgi:hypothetical protein